MGTKLLLLVTVVGLASCQNFSEVMNETEAETLEGTTLELEEPAFQLIEVVPVPCPVGPCTFTNRGFCVSVCIGPHEFDYSDFSQSDIDEEKCPPESCKCCRTCEASDSCLGGCVPHVKYCGLHYGYSKTDCKDCICCKECAPEVSCHQLGGICVNPSKECPCDYTKVTSGQCTNGCKCCAKCVVSPQCPDDDDEGICVPEASMCHAPNQYLAGSTSCCSPPCLYCKTCKALPSCSEQSGHCIRIDAKCSPGMKVYEFGKCSSDNCICCRPDPCPGSCKCVRASNRGQCVIRGKMACNEYEGDEECLGKNCICKKTCKPDATCAEERGTCFSRKSRCSEDLVPSARGRCADHTHCVCCVPKVTSGKLPFE